MCRSCPRTEAQEADLWAAPLGQIRLNDIAGWPLLISRAALDAHRFERVATDAAGLGWRALMIVFGPFCMAQSLVVARKMLRAK